MSFIERLLNNQIEFPYARLFLPRPMVMFNNFLLYEPKISNQRYYLHYYYPYYKLYLPPLFRGQSCLVMDDGNSYLTINGLTDYFTEEVRNKARKCYDSSIDEAWRNPQFLRQIVGKMRGDGKEELSLEELRRFVYQGAKEPGLFRLTWAKGLLYAVLGDSYKDKLRMLDISAGWGDRLITAISLGYEYMGFDPNINLKRGHDEIISMFGDVNKHKVIYRPFEDCELTKDVEYDVILTSPPFFDLEIYDKSEGQSNMRYPFYSKWMKEGLFVWLRKAWEVLKEGGYLIIHMGDTSKIKICEPMNLYIEQYLSGSSWEGVIGLLGSKNRPSPVWVWKKCRDGMRNRWDGGEFVGGYGRELGKLYPSLGV